MRLRDRAQEQRKRLETHFYNIAVQRGIVTDPGDRAMLDLLWEVYELGRRKGKDDQKQLQEKRRS